MGKKKKKKGIRNYEIWLEKLKSQPIINSLPLEIVSQSMKLELALNLNTSIEVLKILSENKDTHIRYNVADNRNTPIEILEKLSKDEDRGVRCSVAENPSTSKEILERLSRDISDSVRFNVVSNPNTPIKILKTLLKDKVWYIRDRAAAILMVKDNEKVKLKDLIDKNLPSDTRRDLYSIYFKMWDMKAQIAKLKAHVKELEIQVEKKE